MVGTAASLGMIMIVSPRGTAEAETTGLPSARASLAWRSTEALAGALPEPLDAPSCAKSRVSAVRNRSASSSAITSAGARPGTRGSCSRSVASRPSPAAPPAEAAPPVDDPASAASARGAPPVAAASPSAVGNAPPSDAASPAAGTPPPADGPPAASPPWPAASSPVSIASPPSAAAAAAASPSPARARALRASALAHRAVWIAVSDASRSDPSPKCWIAAVHISQAGFSFPPKPTFRQALLTTFVCTSESSPSSRSRRHSTNARRNSRLKTSPPLEASTASPERATTAPIFAWKEAFAPASFGWLQIVVCEGTQIAKILFFHSVRNASMFQREAWPSRKRSTGSPPGLRPSTHPPWSASTTRSLMCCASFGKSSRVIEPEWVAPMPILHVSSSSACPSRRKAFSLVVGVSSGTASPRARASDVCCAPLPPPRALTMNGAQTFPSALVVMPSVKCLPILFPSEERAKQRRMPSSIALLPMTFLRFLPVDGASSSYPYLHRSGTSSYVAHGTRPIRCSRATSASTRPNHSSRSWPVALIARCLSTPELAFGSSSMRRIHFRTKRASGEKGWPVASLARPPSAIVVRMMSRTASTFRPKPENIARSQPTLMSLSSSRVKMRACSKAVLPFFGNL
mmetsp:Transcript_61410/g.168701  ORF Transcript_61410/g.168701 Transcript_61410/m.168701 type:complete len:632 (-) Transcript_61410:190-2085(-)